MPELSRRERIARLRRALISENRWVSALLVVVSHEGKEVFRVGGTWDKEARRYVKRACTPHVYQLQESQLELAKGFARWLEAAQKGKARRRVIIGGGNRGSGKTWFLGGVAMVAVALAFPDGIQFGINLSAKQKREVLEAIADVAKPEWITNDVNDLRDPRTEFLTGSLVQWLSAQNPRAIRQAGLPIRYVLINEGQDQPSRVYTNAIAAIRNTGGLLGIATNPPQVESGDWVAALWQAIEAEEVNGEKYLLDNKLNRAIDQDAVDDIGRLIYAVDRTAGDADAMGDFRLSGPIAYPGFKALPRERGGHIGTPPEVGWIDVTRELSAKCVDSSVGFDYVCGVDFQRQPGIIGNISKLYRTEKNELVLHVLTQVAARGVEADFSQALIASGYTPNGQNVETGKPAPSVLLIGDGTGARQNAEHKFHQPTSFHAIRADGWKIVPPMYHWRHRTPWNPLVKDSRAQMHLLFERHQILLAPTCKEPLEGFSSLVESFRRSKTGPKGGLMEKGGFQHSPDGVRYLAWCFLPRPQPAMGAPMKAETRAKLRSIRLLQTD